MKFETHKFKDKHHEHIIKLFKNLLKIITNQHKFKNINNDSGRSFDDGRMTKKKKSSCVF